VRDYIIDNALMWLGEMHVDGLRLDAVHALHESASSPVHILQEIAERVDALSAHVGRPLSLIAESDLNDPIMILPREAGGYGLTAQWVDDWHHAVHVALTGETDGYYADFADPQALPKTWTGGFYHDGTFSSFRGRDWGAPLPAAVPSWRLVTFAQDHDQIGNRAAGDRLSQSLTPARLEVAAVLTMTAPGTPMLFMGEEWGPPRRGSSSPRTPNPSSPPRPARDARPSSRGWGGTSRSCPTRTTRRRSSGRSWTGPNSTNPPTRACCRCTGRSRDCGGIMPS
jgi:maltooligosyltrehalose trehalohydrolase